MPRPYTLAQLKKDLRQGYAWPGGYEYVYIMEDGCLMCGDCIRKNFRLVVQSMKEHLGDGWGVWGCQYEAVSAYNTPPHLRQYCEQCQKEWGEMDGGQY